jgi:uncharacterized Zn finger protein
VLCPATAETAAPKAREGAQAKGRRYLVSGRVTILRAGPGRVSALVRGDGAFYDVTYRDGVWSCPCLARTDCAHLVAVRLCTAPEFTT